jgi:hypothetical protein
MRWPLREYVLRGVLFLIIVGFLWAVLLGLQNLLIWILRLFG